MSEDIMIMVEKIKSVNNTPTPEKKNRGGGGEKKIVNIDPISGEEQNTKL